MTRTNSYPCLAKGVAFLLLATACGQAQTAVNLGTQSKNVDFSAFLSTKPSSAGLTLPSTCSLGQTFLKTNASPGVNFYVCTSTNTWTVQGGNATKLQGLDIALVTPTDGQALLWSQPGNAWEPGSLSSAVSLMALQLGDFRVIQSSSTVLSIGAGCSTDTPCNVRFAGTTTTYTAPATVTITAGSGVVALYIDGTVAPAVLKVRAHGPTVNCAGMSCVVESGVGFPDSGIPIFTWTATGGAWNATGGTDYRAMLSTAQIAGSIGSVVIQSGGLTTVGVDTAVVPTFLTGSATIAFPLINNAACAAEETFALPGAVVNDGVAPGWPPTLAAGLIGMMRVSAADTIAVRVCNLSGADITPASATFLATIVRHF